MTIQLAPQVRSLLEELYGRRAGRMAECTLAARLAEFRSSMPVAPVAPPLNERDVLLIAYPDQVTEPDRRPLLTLAAFADRYLAGLISGLHILPFFPSTSDGGFAVADYTAVDPGYGSWDDIQRLSRRFTLMFDLVLNHTSSRHAWFRGFLGGESRYRDYYLSPRAEDDLSRVVRPRALPLVTVFDGVRRHVPVWTTFSADQVDLNYANPAVLLEMVDVLLQYVASGARLIRLDAVAYLWKQPGTTCIHLPGTHRVIRLLRAVLDTVAPQVLLVTETNVPHAENLSYFGGGQGEAQLVYNFALPPLVLHSLLSADGRALSGWAARLELPSENVTFLNFLASHDGIGLNPARNLLEAAEVERLVAAARRGGGRLGLKSDPEGGESVYELNVNYFDALNPPDASESDAVQVDRFIAAHAILLALKGVPALYFHSLVGSRGWPEGVEQSGQNRAINRQKLAFADLEARLQAQGSLNWQVYQRLSGLLRTRATLPAFDPYAPQQILDAGLAVFALLRETRDLRQQVLCLVNLSDKPQTVRAGVLPAIHGVDQVSDSGLDSGVDLHLEPYQVVWLAG